MPSKFRPILRALHYLATASVSLLILGAAVYAVVIINRTEPTAEQINSTRKSAALVETITVTKQDYRPQLVVLGTVTPAQDIVLSPRVSGQVIELSDSFVPGQTVTQGEMLLQIDPADFDIALAIRESELSQAQASLRIEEGQGELAKKELAILADSIVATNRELILRVPQIESIRAEVKAAEAAVERALLDIERTSIVAPFDAQILRRSVNVGSQVSDGDELARLVGIEEYWIIASVPVRSLRWVQFAGDGVSGSQVKLRNPGTWPDNAERTGEVSRMIGTLDEESRLAPVLITVKNPLSSENGTSLIIDTIVETHIEGQPIKNVVRLSRDYIRDNDTVWVMKDDKLEIRQPTIDFRDADFAYISAGLDDGDEVVTTTLATVAAGIGLKRVEADGASLDATPESNAGETNEEPGSSEARKEQST